MTDRPLIFSAPMVRALLDGRKTQTRRVLKPPYGTLEYLPTGTWEPICTKVFRGDRLYVREAHALVGTVDPQWVLYRADGYESECARHGFDRPYPPEPRWRPSIHMPRWASRLTLVVTDVRVQRLQEISEADAVAEGVTGRAYQARDGSWIADPKASFAGGFGCLWNSLYGPDAWDANPWVAAISFDVHRCNIDQRVAAQNGRG